MNRPTYSALFILLVFSFLAVQAGAQDKTMYSWTDEDGTVHFSDTRPDGQEVREQAIPQNDTSVSAGVYQEAAPVNSAAQQKREDIARKNEQAQVNRAMTDARCSAWQAEVDRLEPHRRVFFTNDQGETERMDDVERTNRVAELKRQIAQNCN